MSEQPVIQKLIGKHEDYFRLMPTPVAEQATREIIYIPQNVFLGTESDMSDIAAAFRKVQNHYAAGLKRATALDSALPDRAEQERARIRI